MEPVSLPRAPVLQQQLCFLQLSVIGKQGHDTAIRYARDTLDFFGDGRRLGDALSARRQKYPLLFLVIERRRKIGRIPIGSVEGLLGFRDGGAHQRSEE